LGLESGAFWGLIQLTFTSLRQ